MTDFKFTAEDFLPLHFAHDEAEQAAAIASAKIAPLVAELEKLRRLTTEPDHGNEYAIVCHYKDEVDKARADLAALKVENGRFQASFDEQEKNYGAEYSAMQSDLTALKAKLEVAVEALERIAVIDKDECISTYEGRTAREALASIEELGRKA